MRRYFFLFSLLIATMSTGQSIGAGIEDQMPPETFRASGLHKLTEDELGRLNQWLQGYLSETRREAHREASESVEPEGEVRSRIDGEFRGWDGKTIFKLKNGQTWVQRTRGRWKHRATDPEVVIERNFLGFFRMTLVEEGRSIGVKLKRDGR